jgi:spore coat polysaccharide biosynthesis protein SpsF (cytidylyltransferase family)
MSKVLCIIQARMGSTRFPGKILKKVKDTSLLEYEINRLRKSKLVDKIVVATTTNSEDNATEELCKKISVDCFRGNDMDVLDRYFKCSQKYPECKTIIRITGDCPLVDEEVVDEVIEFFNNGEYDYASNIEFGKHGYPDGINAEILTKEALEKSWKDAKLKSEREHVTLYIRNNPSLFKSGHISSERDLSNYRLTVDNPEDFEVIKFLMETVGTDAGYKTYVETLDKNPDIINKNAHLKRYDGLKKSIKND